jgi:signal transduction histidine kinase
VTQFRLEQRESPQPDPIAKLLEGRPTLSAEFQEEHLSGRVIFVDLPAQEVPSAVDVVAREMGNSLERRHLARQMRLLAVSEERIRLARDLHDGVLQSLTGIRLQLQTIAETARSQGRDHLLAIERALAIEQRELRLFIESVRPSARPSEESRPLADGLEEMRERLEREWKTTISIRIASPMAALRPAMYRAVRLMLHEAIVNALKHGHPSRISVTVQEAGEALRLVVQDDGRGFAFVGRLDHPALVASGAGPGSLRDRVSAMGGTMAVESSQGGASVEILLPL